MKSSTDPVLSPNSSDTAIVISDPTGKRAIITRGSATEVIHDHEEKRRQAASRSVLESIAKSAIVGLGFGAVPYVTDVSSLVTAFWIGAIATLAALFYFLFASQLAPAESVEWQVDALASRSDVLTACSPPIADQLTSWEHKALKVAARHDVLDELLDLLVYQHSNRIEGERLGRYNLAQEITDIHMGLKPNTNSL